MAQFSKSSSALRLPPKMVRAVHPFLRGPAAQSLFGTNFPTWSSRFVAQVATSTSQTMYVPLGLQRAAIFTRLAK